MATTYTPIPSVRRNGVIINVYEGSKLITTLDKKTNLISMELERAGSNQFFGQSILSKLKLKVIDINNDLNLSTANSLVVNLNYYKTYFQHFYISEIHRDDKTNVLSITAYDKMYELGNLHIRDLELPASYTLVDLVRAIAGKVGLKGTFYNLVNNDLYKTPLPNGANLEGSETLREVIDDIAEFTGSVAYIDVDTWDYKDRLLLKQLSLDKNAFRHIGRNDYIELETWDNRRLTGICSATSLGNNIVSKTTQIGTTMYIRDNSIFTALSETDAAAALDYLIGVRGNFTMGQFELEWRGQNYFDIGECLEIEKKDGTCEIGFLLDDVITYDGSLKEKTKWKYEETEETADNPTNLGDKLKQTYARVDKANKQVDIVVSDIAANKEEIAAINANTKSISASVSQVQQQQNETTQDINADIAELRKTVDTKIDADSVKIAVQQEMGKGINKVQTSTGYVFDDNGLSISKSSSEMTTTITENGMSVNKNGNAVLTANNEGVNAEDLHATTYMIIGDNSRFEDWGSSYTACFWIGG